MEQLTFSFLTPLPEDFSALENKIKWFAEVLNKNINSLSELLSGYHFSSRGKVYNPVVVNETLQFQKELAGKFKTQYHILYTNGCQDLTFEDKDDKWIYFEIDLDTRQIKLTGEIIPERLPDEF